MSNWAREASSPVGVAGFDPRLAGYLSTVIEVREEYAHPECPAGLIYCAESGGAAGVVRFVELALRLGHMRVVVNLRESDAVDADLLSALHRLGRRVREAGGRLAVVCADSRRRRLLDLTLLSQSFRVYETHEEALAG